MRRDDAGSTEETPRNPRNCYCWRLLTLVTVRRPFVLTTRTGFATDAVALTVCVVAVWAFVASVVTVLLRVPAVREELTVASVDEPEMLAGGLTTAAAVGESVRALASADGVTIELAVGVAFAAVVGATTTPPAFVTVAPVTVDAEVTPLVTPAVASVATTVLRKVVAASVLPTGSPAPLRIPSVGAE